MLFELFTKNSQIERDFELDAQHEHTKMQTQHAQQHVSPLPVRVDVRLCGGIPRKDMKVQLIKDNGARCSLSALTSRSETSLNISCLAAANGPTSDCSTHRTIAVCDALSGHGMHNIKNTSMTTNTNNMLQTIENLQKSTPLAPLMEVPSWAVPARGESRLEVSLILALWHSRYCLAIINVVSNILFFFFFSLFAIQLEDSQPLT
jgi:hypothetical protein